MSTPSNVPSYSDFKSSFTCTKCNAFNPSQDIRTSHTGAIHRVCSSCHSTNDLYYPATDIVIDYTYVSTCHPQCSCTQFTPTSPGDIMCTCGHLGSYHGMKQVPSQYKHLKAKVKVSELKSINQTELSFDLSQCEAF
ncbi:hypothetical protein C9374_007315 [Naegleria lovaniensis]|uniref:Uncharacterized protein n=1 Tax=Naegleria lovaniensis TaxID=51637 RepID=A0AA88GML0_NAELO|nr:uncharacterized protein C9374_007315 [Naegleria lovaniensis]KAG2379176.1 hypothetical protein C9374_007315 [Naegleria lovaniensis]